MMTFYRWLASERPRSAKGMAQRQAGRARPVERQPAQQVERREAQAAEFHHAEAPATFKAKPTVTQGCTLSKLL